MCCKGFIKRILPFFLTFSLGLLIASFFVSIAAPNFNFKKRGFNRHRKYDRRMEFENRQLRDENNRLKQQLLEKENQNLSEDLDIPAPPLPPKMRKLVLKEEVRTVKVQ
jgi:cell shape-determining protein MreC